MSEALEDQVDTQVDTEIESPVETTEDASGQNVRNESTPELDLTDVFEGLHSVLRSARTSA